ncbi:methylated-DNA--[protein]-cysteine S-methyltransferase [Alicyclobacillus sp.]|uniref:methylated-DNA--[protein]-cysteine S-methyltransferase n=1 Tax=Alicyclobacillus sp. TaxID=61169 RepID=UPI0025C725E2|nr:methylated-DNA--[protein]-cysteine S-methyltransferase [Alicyclobacillus sp.]MCL6518062.1 methylated-DNA--[protein]-cysteine S-methyltransferase [Alicyclobacillus sp.]
MQEVVSWGQVEYGGWTLYAAVHEDGRLCRVTVPGESLEALGEWIAQQHGPVTLAFNPEVAGPACTEILEYLKGQRREFSIPLAMHGTDFQVRVWEALRQIPFGEVRTYKEIAREVGRPTAVRAVAAANGANPLPIVVPCHRVIGSDCSLTGYSGGLFIKARLLELEGHRLFNGRQVVHWEERALLHPRTRVSPGQAALASGE